MSSSENALQAQSDFAAQKGGWRRIEALIIDHVHRRERGRIINECGQPYVGVAFYADDGRELEQKTVIDIERLAKAIADSI
jgi:hypothetical protein